jgi:hypothetical protein
MRGDGAQRFYHGMGVKSTTSPRNVGINDRLLCIGGWPTLTPDLPKPGVSARQLSVASCQLPVKTTADPSISLGCARDDKRQLSVASSQLKKLDPPARRAAQP